MLGVKYGTGEHAPEINCIARVRKGDRARSPITTHRDQSGFALLREEAPTCDHENPQLRLEQGNKILLPCDAFQVTEPSFLLLSAFFVLFSS